MRYKISAVAEMGDRLATIDMAEKCVGCCAPSFWGRSWVLIYHNVAWAEAYLRSTKWHLDPPAV